MLYNYDQSVLWEKYDVMGAIQWFCDRYKDKSSRPTMVFIWRETNQGSIFVIRPWHMQGLNSLSSVTHA